MRKQTRRPRGRRHLAGVVLVGGRSLRMGCDKARLIHAGVPLWRRQVRLLEQIGAEPVLLGLRPRQRSFGLAGREIRDRVRDAGPLSGLQTALLATDAEWLAVVAVDMPCLDEGWFRRLRRACQPGRGAVIRHAGGFEPLAAIYPRVALPVVTRRLATRKHRLSELVAELVRRRMLRVVALPSAEFSHAANWNRPADLGSGRTRRHQAQPAVGEDAGAQPAATL